MSNQVTMYLWLSDHFQCVFSLSLLKKKICSLFCLFSLFIFLALFSVSFLVYRMSITDCVYLLSVALHQVWVFIRFVAFSLQLSSPNVLMAWNCMRYMRTIFFPVWNCTLHMKWIYHHNESYTQRYITVLYKI